MNTIVAIWSDFKNNLVNLEVYDEAIASSVPIMLNDLCNCKKLSGDHVVGSEYNSAAFSDGLRVTLYLLPILDYVKPFVDITPLRNLLGNEL